MTGTDADTVSNALRAASYDHERTVNATDGDSLRLPMRVYTGQELLTLLGILQQTPGVKVTLDPNGITIS